MTDPICSCGCPDCQLHLFKNPLDTFGNQNRDAVLGHYTFVDPISREPAEDLSQTGYLIRDSKPLDPKGEAGSKKCPLHLIPVAAMEETAYVHQLGSNKYGEYNWRATGVSANTYIAAILRHLNAYREGEDLDPESGRSHIAHIAANANILLDAAACNTLVDDRFKKPL